jgi:hypothetical protein
MPNVTFYGHFKFVVCHCGLRTEIHDESILYSVYNDKPALLGEGEVMQF